MSQTVGLTDVEIIYGRPGVKGRTVWGELVPWNQVWRTGANEATTFGASAAIFIDGQPLAAGRYSLHTIPGEKEWIVIFNTVDDQWGSFNYDESADALRIRVKPRRAADHREWLSFRFQNLTMDSAEVVLHWERLEVAFTIKSAAVRRSLAAIEVAMTRLEPDDWRTPYRAAYFCYHANLRLDDALGWVRRSIEAEGNWFNLQLQANLLARKGDTAAAIVAAEKALAANERSKQKFDTTPMKLKIEQWRKASTSSLR